MYMSVHFSSLVSSIMFVASMTFLAMLSAFFFNAPLPLGIMINPLSFCFIRIVITMKVLTVIPSSVTLPLKIQISSRHSSINLKQQQRDIYILETFLLKEITPTKCKSHNYFL